MDGVAGNESVLPGTSAILFALPFDGASTIVASGAGGCDEGDAEESKLGTGVAVTLDSGREGEGLEDAGKESTSWLGRVVTAT